jgi:hypothetical protein
MAAMVRVAVAHAVGCPARRAVFMLSCANLVLPTPGWPATTIAPGSSPMTW